MSDYFINSMGYVGAKNELELHRQIINADLLSPLKQGGSQHGNFGCGRPHLGGSGAHPLRGMPKSIIT